MYFFDTYAIIEIINGNENYKRFNDIKIITSIVNLGELYYVLIREIGEEKTEMTMNKFNFNLIEIKQKDMKEAMKFRFENKPKNLSFIDCVGYLVAKNNGLKFLTGDNGFKDVPDVEFIK